MRLPYVEPAPRTPEERLLRAIFTGPVVRRLRKLMLPLWEYAEAHEDEFAGWLAMRIADAIDTVTAWFATKPRVRFK